MSKKLVFTVFAASAVALLAMNGCGDSDTATKEHHKAEDKTASPKPYPLDKCLVSGEKLGEMGEPVVMVHEGQEIKFCCKSCVKDFKKDPEKYLAILRRELSKEEKSGPDDHDHDGHDH